jgi:catechol 2,3-dioxygenase-like lactoylglutathione lyase family enzyme
VVRIHQATQTWIRSEVKVPQGGAPLGRGRIRGIEFRCFLFCSIQFHSFQFHRFQILWHPMGARMKLRRITTVLVVDRVEDQIAFWVDGVGMELEVTVPHEQSVGFAILKQGTTELMLQSRASVAADIPSLARDKYTTALFIEVDDLDSVIDRLRPYEQIYDRRTTFYGADEIGFRDPSGNAITFAQFSKKAESTAV